MSLESISTLPPTNMDAEHCLWENKEDLYTYTIYTYLRTAHDRACLTRVQGGFLGG